MLALSDVAPTLGAGAIAVLGDLGQTAPLLVVAAWSLLLLVADAYAGTGLRVFQRRLALVGVALAAILAAARFGAPEYDAGVPVFSGFLVVDHFALLVDLGILGTAAAVILFAGDYARTHRFEYGEQEALVLIAAFGVMMLAHAADLLAVFLGIETMSIAVYVLVGARWNSKRAPEAALKYFLMGAFASGLLLMGMALLYGATGSTGLDDLNLAITRVFHEWRASQVKLDLVLHPEGAPASAVANARDDAVVAFAPVALLIPGILLTLAALLFKVSAVPFHMWTPDAYDGAPTPTTAFMAAGVKLGAFAALLKIFVGVLNTRVLVVEPYGWTTAMAWVAFLTMTVGNFAAVRQSNVKRLLAFSSIAHVGYLLVGVVAAANFYGQGTGVGAVRGDQAAAWAYGTGDLTVAGILYYLLTYAIATLGAFAAVAWFGSYHNEAEGVHHWAGLGQRHPGVALAFTLCLLSFMGMPPFAGFVGKVALFRGALENDNPTLRFLVVAALLNSVVGAYYYLRIVVAMYFRPPVQQEIPVTGSRGALTVAVVAGVASLVLGIAATPLLRASELAAAGFVITSGSDARAQWVERLRDRWEAEEASPEAEKDAGTPEGEVPADAKGEPEADKQAPANDGKPIDAAP